MNGFFKNKNKLALWVLGMVLWVSSPLALLAQTSNVIQVGDGTVDAGASVSIPLSINLESESLSAITLKLGYDLLVLQATDCEIVEFIGACNISVAGEIAATAIDPAGVNGTFVLINITFSAIDTMSVSDMVTNIVVNEVSTFAGPTGEGIEGYTLDNGEVLIRAMNPTSRVTPSATPLPTETPTQVLLTSTPLPTETPTTETPTTETPTTVPENSSPPTEIPTAMMIEAPRATAEPTQIPATSTPLPTREPTRVIINTPKPTSTPRPAGQREFIETDNMLFLPFVNQ